MPAIEQQHPTDRVPPPNGFMPGGLQNEQRDAWGPGIVSVQRTYQTSALDAFGQLSIADSSIDSSLRTWCSKPFNEFQAPPELNAAEKELERSKGSLDDHILGVEVGTVKAVYSVGNGVIGIGNAITSPPARLGNWLANTIKDPATAISDSAKLGNDVGNAMANGIKSLHRAGGYVDEIKHAQSKGDYLKPIVDAGHQLNEFTDRFKKMTPAQQTEAVSEQVVNLGTQIASGKILASASQGFASLMEKMDEFKLKSDAYRVQLGIEEKAGSAEKLSTHERKTQELAATQHGDGEKHVAGARNSRFNYEEIESYRSPQVPIQCHKNACVAAVGEILSEGKIDQHAFVQRLERYLHPEQRGKEAALSLKALRNELGFDWEFKAIDQHLEAKTLLADLLARQTPFGVTLKAYRVDPHAVVVDGLNEAGRLVIHDPGDGKIYQMTIKEFDEHWTGLAVAKKYREAL